VKITPSTHPSCLLLTGWAKGIQVFSMTETRARKALLLLLFLHCAYACIFIAKTSFVIEGERYFCLVDDAMVSMRYAFNLAQGEGWRWNPGEAPVEGYTNPLWCLVMSAIHLLPVPLSKTSLIIQIVEELCLLANICLIYMIGKTCLSWGAGIAAAALTAFYFPLNNWALQGMEVGPIAVCVALTVLSFVRYRNAENPPWSLFIPTAILMALRPDGVVLHIVAVLLACSIWRSTWRQTLFLGFVYLVAVSGSWSIFRRLYYGDWFPNTYYLKMTGFPALLRMTRGAFHAAVFWGHLLFPVIALFVLWAARHRGRIPWKEVSQAFRCIGLRNAIVLVLVQTAYSVYVGGDAWERITGANRFIAPVVPLAFLSVVGIYRIIAQTPTIAQTRRSAILFTAAWAIYANSYYGVSSLSQALLLADPPYKADNVRNVRLARLLEEMTKPNARIAIDYAGTAPYFLRRPMIDLLGKSDRQVAREQAHRGVLGLPAYREFYPGHLKWNYAYSIGQLKPDVVCAIWRRTLDNAHDFLARAYLWFPWEDVSIYLRKGSPAILWENVPHPLSEVTTGSEVTRPAR
jgi:hypothetical protein